MNKWIDRLRIKRHQENEMTRIQRKLKNDSAQLVSVLINEMDMTVKGVVSVSVIA